MSTQMLMHSKQPQVPFVDLAAQYRTIEREINEATSRVIQQTDFILGREVSLFEEEFAAFCEAKYAVGVDSGTSAFPDAAPPEDLVVIDCIEFTERFRYADPLADMAFLVMDLIFHGRRDLVCAFADA